MPKPRRGRRGGLIVGVAVVVVLAAAAAVWWFAFRSTPEKTMAAFVAASRAGNEQAAEAWMTPDTVKALNDFQKVLGGLQRSILGAVGGSKSAAPALGGNIKLACILSQPPFVDVNVKIGKAQIVGGSATVPIRFVAKKAAAKTKGGPAPTASPYASIFSEMPSIPIQMTRQGMTWKIDLAQKITQAKQFMTYFANSSKMKALAKQMGGKLGGNLGGKLASSHVGKAPLDFTAQDLAGKPVVFSSFKGKPVVLDFCATWCPPCRAELPVLDDYYAKLKGRGVQIVAVFTDQKVATVTAFVKDHPLGFKTLWLNPYGDVYKGLSKKYGIMGIPRTLYIGSDWLVKADNIGFSGKEEVATSLAKIGMGTGEAEAPQTVTSPTSAPADVTKLVAEGMADKKAGHLDAAAAKLKQACQADPKSCDAHWDLAWVLVSEGDKTEAKAEFQKVIALNTDPKETSGARDALARMK